MLKMKDNFNEDIRSNQPVYHQSFLEFTIMMVKIQLSIIQQFCYVIGYAVNLKIICPLFLFNNFHIHKF